MTAVMSTSLKVVSWAAVFWDSLRRNAMVLRKRVIATFSSRASLWRGPVATVIWGAVVGATARAASAPSISPFVTRPSLPVPVTEAVAMPASSAMRRAEGIAGTSVLVSGTGLGVSALGASALG